MQYSFYGGQQGKSFKISGIFETKVALAADLNMRWSSPIGVGEFVIVSYGLPNTATDSEYTDHAKIDVDKYGKSYNTTLWEKIYVEDGAEGEVYPFDPNNFELIFPDNATYGVAYKLIAAMTGNTPQIRLKAAEEPLDANQDPYAELDITNIDYPVFTLHLPKAQVLQLLDTIDLDANESPTVRLDDSDINSPKLQFSLPQSQVLQLQPLPATPAGTDPTLALDDTNINRPILKISLPKGQVLKLGAITPIDANLDPKVTQDNANINEPRLNFELPKSQVLGLKETVVLPPQEDPSVDLDETNINEPKLTFSLPRAVQMLWGDQLGKKSEINYRVAAINFNGLGLEIGDYYVNQNTGYVYMVTSVNDTEIAFKYIGCIRAPVPNVGVTEVDPYNETGEEKTPISVDSQYQDETEETGWKLQFSIPRIPDPDVVVNAVAPDDRATANVAPINQNTIRFSFDIPRGSRIFSGNVIKEAGSQVTITDTIDNGDTITAQNGDIYLNSETGSIFILREGVWRNYNGNLKGPKGDSLKIALVLSFDSETYPNADTNGAILNEPIQTAFNSKFGRLPNADELIAVTWIDKNVSGDTDFSYWYFYAEDSAGNKKWDRATLTGGLQSLLFGEYIDGIDASSIGYTAQYINGLIGGTITDTNKDKKTFSADQIISMLKWGDFANVDTDPYPPNNFV